MNHDFISSNVQQTQENSLLKYLQHQNPEVLARVAKSASPEIKEIVSQNVQGLLGTLPIDNFNVQITTDRENLVNLLASAMMTGYFLSQMEHRMYLDKNLSTTTSIYPNSTSDE